MKSLMTASTVVMSLGLTFPASAQDTRPTSPQHSPLAQTTPAQRDPGRQSPLAAAAADTKAGSVQMMNSVPAQSVTVKDWYKQSVYDPSNSKIGDIMDVLLSQDGKVSALIIGVAAFSEWVRRMWPYGSRP
jgi:hypothetical protein